MASSVCGIIIENKLRLKSWLMDLKPILLEHEVLGFETATGDVGWKDTNNMHSYRMVHVFMHHRTCREKTATGYQIK